ncbi:hypothetical protein [Flavobacterium sp.]|uniref:hypothetical protein n=1 Tax=Flavobacterium sp. TaxID=239 RepID=UPI0037BF23CC
MSDNQNNDNVDNVNQNQNQNDDNNQNDNQNQNDDKNKVPDVDKIIQSKIDEQLKDIKGKLDKAYGARDEALKKVADFEKEKREAELKRLQEEGKHKEAYEMQLAEEKTKREAAEKRNIELTRDIDVRSTLMAQPFRNDNALEMAYREIVGQLVQNEQGVWVHKTGLSISDYVKAFAENDANSFLFKVKQSSGSGSSGVNSSNNDSSEKKSLFAMSQDEVLKMAREGKLRK